MPIPTLASCASNCSLLIHYADLSNNERILYERIITKLLAFEESITIPTTDAEEISRTYNAVRYDHPEIFWVDSSLTFTVGMTTTTLYPGYNTPLSEVPSVQARIDNEVADFLHKTPLTLSSYKRLKAAYEHVILNTSYDKSAEQNQNIQSVFLNHASVCAGYSAALQYLLTLVHVPSAVVIGTIRKDNERHAWNLVCVDGVMLNVDATWGDPTYIGPDGKVTTKESIEYRYLGLTDSEIGVSHVPLADSHVLPQCRSSKYDWYSMHGTLFDSFDFNTIDRALAEAVLRGEHELEAKYTTKSALDKARAVFAKAIAYNGRFGKALRSTGLKSYHYRTFDDLRVLEITW